MQSPLADRLRPRTLAEVCGQQHLLGPGRVFRKAIESGRVPNMIFYGPSGVGKTTVARIIAENSGMRLHKLNGTSAGTGDIKAVMAEIGTFQSRNGLLLYLDEIQYLNKKQQQSLLECMEDGTVTLIASTTENPYFYIYNALLSRATVFEFKPLTPEDVRRGLENALHKLEELDGVRIEAQPEALDALAAACGGDMRKALGSLEFAVAGAAETDGANATTKATTCTTTASRRCRKAFEARTRTPPCIIWRAFWKPGICCRPAGGCWSSRRRTWALRTRRPFPS